MTIVHENREMPHKHTERVKRAEIGFKRTSLIIIFSKIIENEILFDCVSALQHI